MQMPLPVIGRFDRSSSFALVALAGIAVSDRAGAPAALSAGASRRDADRRSGNGQRPRHSTDAPRRPGNPSGVPLPDEARPVDTSHPDVVIGTGTPASCTSQAVVDAVAHGGIITFDCGPDPVTIVMTDTAKVVNTSPVVVLDGGGKVTLSGAGQRRILYMNTCDQAQIWTTSHCQNQDQPAAHDPAPALHPGQQHRRPARGRRRRRRVRPRRPGEGGRERLHRQPVRPDRARPRRRRAAGAQPVPGPAGDRRHEHVRPAATSARTGRRSRASACRGRSTTASSPTTTPSAAAPTRPAPGTPGGGSGGAIYLDGNLFTLDLAGQHRARQHGQRGRWRDLLRLQRPHRRAPHHEVGAATATRATASRPPASRGSSSSAGAHRR